MEQSMIIINIQINMQKELKGNKENYQEKKKVVRTTTNVKKNQQYFIVNQLMLENFIHIK